MPWTCEFCNSETQLGYNVCSNCQKPRPGSQSAGDVTATPIPVQQQFTGVALETILDFVAWSFLILGMVASVVVFAYGSFAAVISTMLSMFLPWMLLRSVAEIIRLLKRIAGLQYAGRISGTFSGTALSCSHCGAIFLQSKVACDACGATLVAPDDSDPSQENS